MSNRDRRDFLKQSGLLAGAAGVLASDVAAPAAAQTAAETRGRTVRRADRYDDSFIFERKPFTWPGNKTLAVWIVPNVEVWRYDSPSGQAITPNDRGIVPDVVNYAWREYGMRVGLWRFADVLDAAGIKATVALNAAVIEHHPKAVEEIKRRGWEFMGHGITNSEDLAGLTLDAERNLIQTALRTIEQATGRRPMHLAQLLQMAKLGDQALDHRHAGIEENGAGEKASALRNGALLLGGIGLALGAFYLGRRILR